MAPDGWLRISSNFSAQMFYLSVHDCASVEYMNTDISCEVEDTNTQLLYLLQEFWRAREIPAVKNSHTNEEKTCEDLFVNTTYREKTGRYIVRLPCKKCRVCNQSINKKFLPTCAKHIEAPRGTELHPTHPVDHVCLVRNYKIALSADVEKIFRQIGVDERDRKFDRTVSKEAAEVIAGILPLEELGKERRRIYRRGRSPEVNTEQMTTMKRQESLKRWQET